MSITPWLKLHSWVKNMSGLDGNKVIRLGTNGPAASAPYITLEVFGRRELGTIHEAFAIPELAPAVDKWRIRGGVSLVFTLRIQVYGTTGDPLRAIDLAELIQLACHNRELHSDILATGLSFQAVLTGATDMTALLGAQMQGRAYVDVQMGVFAPFFEASGMDDQTLEVIQVVRGDGQLYNATILPLNVILDTDPT